MNTPSAVPGLALVGAKEDNGDVKRQPLPFMRLLFSRESAIHVHEEGIQTRGKSRLRPEEVVELEGTLGMEEPDLYSGLPQKAPEFSLFCILPP